MEKIGTSVVEMMEFNSQWKVMQYVETIQMEKGDCVNQGKFAQLLEIEKLDFE